MESQSSNLDVTSYTQEGLPIWGRVCWYDGEGSDTRETCLKDLKKAPLGEGRMWSFVEPEMFSVPEKEHARTRWTWRKRKALKEATHPPSSIECSVKRVP